MHFLVKMFIIFKFLSIIAGHIRIRNISLLYSDFFYCLFHRRICPDCGSSHKDVYKRQVPLVLHGGSGIPKEVIWEAKKHGLIKINYGSCLLYTSHQRSCELRESIADDDHLCHFSELVEEFFRAREWINLGNCFLNLFQSKIMFF